MPYIFTVMTLINAICNQYHILQSKHDQSVIVSSHMHRTKIEIKINTLQRLKRNDLLHCQLSCLYF
jgi:hypothetical protein